MMSLCHPAMLYVRLSRILLKYCVLLCVTKLRLSLYVEDLVLCVYVAMTI